MGGGQTVGHTHTQAEVQISHSWNSHDAATLIEKWGKHAEILC